MMTSAEGGASAFGCCEAIVGKDPATLPHDRAATAENVGMESE